MSENLTSSDMDLSPDDVVVADPIIPVKADDEPEVPEKYKGKTKLDVILMHQNAERKLSQQGSELGEYRKLVMQPPPEKTQQADRKPLTLDTLVENPDKAILDAVTSSPVAQRLETQINKLEELERDVAYRNFSSVNPGWQADIADQAFLTWVSKNPVRVHLASQADARDFNAATNLWALWQEHKDLTSTVKQEKKEQKFVEARTTKTGAGETAPATTYSRAKLMELRRRAYSGSDTAASDRLREIQPDLIQAYKEGRVKD